MGTVDNHVDKLRGNFGDSTYPRFLGFYPPVIQGGNPQKFPRIYGRLIEKLGNLQTYDYY